MASHDYEGFGGPVTQFFTESLLDAEVESADPWALDLIELRFKQPMALTTALSAVTSYTVVGDNGSTPQVVRVFALPRDAAYADGVWLHVTPLVAGEQHTVTVTGALESTKGSRLKDGAATALFVARRTAVDSLIASLPRAFNATPGSRIRHLLNAIGRQLDIQRGSRRDYLP
jgi:hypothetical protein